MNRSRRAALVAIGAALLLLVLWLVTSTDPEQDTAAGVADQSASESAPALVETPTAEPSEVLKEVETAQGGVEDERLPAGPPEPEPGVLFEGEITWIQGRLELPQGTPADERVLVLALKRSMRFRELYDSPSPAEVAWTEGNEHADLLSFTEPGPDGSFRIAVPADSDQAHLALAARYLFSRATTGVFLPAPEKGVPLTGALGSWVTGWISVPEDALPDEQHVADLEIEMGPDIGAGFDAVRLQETAVTLEGRTDAQGGFEFRGVPAEGVHGVAVRHQRLAPLTKLGIRTAPGEKLRIEVPLTRGATLRGRVLGPDSQPLAGADVEVRFPGVLGDAISRLRQTTTDLRGHFELLGVPLGKLELRAEHEEHRNARQSIENELSEGDVVEGIEITLDAGLIIEGIVLFPDGTPAGGAWVHARPDLSAVGRGGMEAMNIARMRGGSEQTDEQGRFAIRGLREGTFVIEARHEEPAPGTEPAIDAAGLAIDRSGDWKATLPGVRPGGDPLEITLARPISLSGRVEEVEGEALTDFVVRATLEGTGGMFGIGAESEERTFVGAEDGAFRIDGLRAGTWKVEVEADGFSRSETQAVVLPQEPEAAQPVFVMQLASQVAGIVLDTADTPVSGAQVTLQVDLARRVRGDIPSTITDIEGRFVLGNLDPGTIVVDAAMDGFAASEAAAADVLPGQSVEDLVLRLRVGGTLIGKVLDDEGEPAAGRRVIVQLTPSYARQSLLKSDGQGEFRVEHLEPGTWQVVATADFMAGGAEDGEVMEQILGEMKIEMVDIVDGEETQVVLGSPPSDPVLVRGRVLHAGEPIGSAFVSFVPEDSKGMSDMKFKPTGEDGRFELRLDHPGPYLVTVQRVGEMGQQDSVEYLERIPEAETAELTLELPLGRISGRVRGPDGKPLAECRVTLNVEGGLESGSFLGGNYTETATDEDGVYEIGYLRPGTYTISAGGLLLGGMFGGEAPAGRAIESGLELSEGEWMRSVDFRLAAPGQLTGVVLDETGAPVKGASVYVRDDAGLPLERFSFIETDAGGHFTYGGLGPGDYTVSARLRSHVSPESRPVRVDSGGSTATELRLEAGTILLINLVDGAGEPTRAHITVRDSEGREQTGLMSMSDIMERFDQRFSSKEQRVGPVPSGRYTVTATHEDGRTRSKPVTVRGRAERKVRIKLR